MNMFSESYLYCNFVKASTSNSGETLKNCIRNDKNIGTLTGSEAKEFYENVISSTYHGNNDLPENSQNDDNSETKSGRYIAEKHCFMLGGDKSTSKRLDEKKPRRNTKKSREKSSKLTRLENKFLQYAQNGDLDELKKLLQDNGINVNTLDQYGWTALMCASFSGHFDVVEFLLHKGALWKDIVNTKGQSALDLATLAKEEDICCLLENWESISRSKKRKRVRAQTTSMWCPICKQEFTQNVNKHQSSTVHQFNCQHKPKASCYGIAGDNPGYKLMVKSGWNEDQGLGPEGEGRKYPIKTVLKRDRHGLGSSNATKPRVTHFGPHDDTAVKRQKLSNSDRRQSQKTLTKKQKRIKESNERAWEKDMRMYMNT